jgi:hypothetical protein
MLYVIKKQLYFVNHGNIKVGAPSAGRICRLFKAKNIFVYYKLGHIAKSAI